MNLKEELLYHIWQYRLFELPMLDMDEEPVELVDPGQLNRDAGPDFFNARVRSDGILWAGNVEIHRKASHWYQHGHHMDQAFDNVILHVVLEPDCRICNSRGREIRTVKMVISPAIRMRYERLMGNPDFIPCWRDLDRIEQGRINIWMERMFIERLEERITRITAECKRAGGDWDEVLFIAMSRAFGQKINADPFEMLARSVPLKKILLHCPDLISKEAVLFGQAGMLDLNPDKIRKPTDKEACQDPYYLELCQRYYSIKQKLGLQSIDEFLWKFLRLRPDNFPTIRISQLACSLEKYPDLFDRLVDHQDPLDLVIKMEFRASEYWTTHYRFGRKSPEREKCMSRNRIAELYINALLPVILACYREKGKPFDMVDFQSSRHRIPAEDNRIIRMWKNIGLEVPDVFYSQALLQLTNKYCKCKRCLSCYIGNQIMQLPGTKK